MIISFFSNILEGTAFLLFYTYIVGQKQFIRKNKLKSLLFMILYIVFCFYVDALTTSGMHTLFYTAFVIIVLGYITRITLFQSLVAAAILIIVLMLTEGITLFLFMSITRKTPHDLLKIVELKFLIHLTGRFIQLSLIFFLYKKNIKLFDFSLFKKKKHFISTGLLQIFIFSLLCMIYLFNGMSSEKQHSTYQLLAFILIILTIIFSIIDYKEKEKQIKISYKLKLQEVNVENMEKLVRILRKNHHDIRNHINTMLAISQIEQPDTLGKIKAYLSNLNDNVKSSFKSYYTGNSYLDGLLAVKNNEAKEKGIQLEVDFDAKVDILVISDQALISIVSNIIDNAFDAMESRVCDRKFISISGYIENDKYILSICNNGPKISEQRLDKIFELGYSSKDDISGYNGYGLYIVKQYVEENNGEISVTSSEDETEFLMKFLVNSFNA